MTHRPTLYSLTEAFESAEAEYYDAIDTRKPRDVIKRLGDAMIAARDEMYAAWDEAQAEKARQLAQNEADEHEQPEQPYGWGGVHKSNNEIQF